MKRLCELFLMVVIFCAGAARPAAAQVSVPEIPFDSPPDFLKMPQDIYLGEAAGVATNSKGHIFVFTRTGGTTVTLGGSRTFMHSGSRLFEFDQTGKYVREIGKDLYAFNFAHAVRVDSHDNIWIVDEGSDLVVEFNAEGRVIMNVNRKDEAVPVPAPPELVPARPGGAGAPPLGTGQSYAFKGPTDVAWDAAGNIFVTDGHGNSRVTKYDKEARFIKAWGSKGTAPGQFNTPHSIVIDAQDNVYVADLGNNRIQVFDDNGNFKTQYLNVGTPGALCITSGPHQYLYSSNSNDPGNMENGEIYKLELDDRIVGKFGRAGKLIKEFGAVHALECRVENEIYAGEITTWRVQKLILHPARTNSSQ
jgi:DNA-binding beta-propeller fold protein YncE